MRKYVVLPFLTTLLLTLLSGCMPYHTELAPCDQYGAGCGNKIKINQW